MQREFFCFLIKRDGDLLIKGVSFDKRAWFLFPKDKRHVSFHSELTKYFSVSKCLKQKRVNRHPGIRITNSIKSIYLNDNNQFVFEGKLLDQDDHLTENSIINEIKSLHQQDIDNKRKSPDEDQLNSTTKKSKIANFDVSDATNLVNGVLTSFGKFKLFINPPEIYISQIALYLKDKIPTDGQESIDFVNSFFGLLDNQLHSWFFENVYKHGLNFAESHTKKN